MGSANGSRRLIVNADDFGRSHAINQAVIRAHRQGILTTASLMVTGEAFQEAVELALENPKLGVGLHLTLVCGRPALPAQEIPGLVTRQGQFSDDAIGAGFKFFFAKRLVPQLEREMAAQFSKFEQTGLTLDHVNGHLNLHLHPRVFRILMERANDWGIKSLRLTRDLLGIDLRLSRGRWLYRLSHAVIFGLLSRRSSGDLARRQIRHTARVFGLLRTGDVTEEYLEALLPRLPEGDSELYSHPSLDDAQHEAEALVSPRVRHLVRENRIELIRYRDL